MCVRVCVCLGNRPPAMVQNKGQYLAKDLTRLAPYMNVPLRQPSDFAEVMFKKGIFLF